MLNKEAPPRVLQFHELTTMQIEDSESLDWLKKHITEKIEAHIETLRLEFGGMPAPSTPVAPITPRVPQPPSYITSLPPPPCRSEYKFVGGFILLKQVTNNPKSDYEHVISIVPCANDFVYCNSYGSPCKLGGMPDALLSQYNTISAIHLVFMLMCVLDRRADSSVFHILTTQILQLPVPTGSLVAFLSSIRKSFGQRPQKSSSPALTLTAQQHTEMRFVELVVKEQTQPAVMRTEYTWYVSALAMQGRRLYNCKLVSSGVGEGTPDNIFTLFINYDNPQRHFNIPEAESVGEEIEAAVAKVEEHEVKSYKWVNATGPMYVKWSTTSPQEPSEMQKLMSSLPATMRVGGLRLHKRNASTPERLCAIYELAEIAELHEEVYI